MATPEKAPRSALDAKWRRWRPHLRRFAPVIGLNHAVTLVIVIAIAVIFGIGAGFGIVPATIAGLWMQINLAPVEMGGVTLGFAPLLPALLIVWLHSKRVTQALGNAVSIRGLQALAAVGLILPILVTCIAWLMLWDASKVYSVHPPNFFVGVLSTALVNGAVMVMGMGARVWRALLLRRGLPTWPVEAFRLARRFLLWMCAAGLAVAVGSMLVNFTALKEAYDITSNASGAFGLTVLSLLYVPNLAVATAGVLMGGEFQIGQGAFSLFAANNVNLPPVPIAAAIPNHQLSFAPFAMVVPALVAVAVVYRYLRQRGYVEAPAYLALTAGAATAFFGYCLCWLAGGELGLFGWTGATPWMFALEAAAWLLVPALVMFLWVARAGSRVVEDIADASPRSGSDLASEPEKSEPEKYEEVKPNQSAAKAEKKTAQEKTKQQQDDAVKQDSELKGAGSKKAVTEESQTVDTEPGTAKKLKKETLETETAPEETAEPEASTENAGPTETAESTEPAESTEETEDS